MLNSAEQLAVKQKFEALRTKLIDLTLRNRMLNFHERSKQALLFRNEESTQVYDRLVVKEQSFSFKGKPDSAKQAARIDEPIDTFGDLFALEELEERAREELDNALIGDLRTLSTEDTTLRTELAETTLQVTLRKLAKDAADLFEETGLDALYLALGTIKWSPRSEDDKQCIAPLLFIPVELRRSKNGKYSLRASSTVTGDNLSLVRKLKVEFDIDFPRFGTKSDPFMYDVTTYFQEVRGAIRAQPGWTIDENWMALSFFQFAKMVMYQDLDEQEWPEEAKPSQDKDLQMAFGNLDSAFEPKVKEGDFLDPFRPVDEAFEVFDCDSSQALAITRAQSGVSMVIEGPPGTGKSQTISNLVAQYVAEGKTVLFVAEKHAALDVVFRKMQESGLQDMCLDLHDKSARPKAFYEELRRVLGLPGIQFDERNSFLEMEKQRRELNSYCESVNTPVLGTQLSVNQAAGHLESIPQEQAEDIPFRVDYKYLSGKSWSQISQVCGTLRTIENKLRTTGPIEQHAFFECSLNLISDQIVLDAKELSRIALEKLEVVVSEVDSFAKELSVPPAQSISEISILLRCAKRAQDAPVVSQVSPQLDLWDIHQSQVEKNLQDLAHFQDIRQRNSSVVHEAIWANPVLPMLSIFEALASKWNRWFYRDFRSANKQLSALLKPSAGMNASERLALLRQVHAAQESYARLSAHEALMSNLFGVQWLGESSDVSVLRSIQTWCCSVRSEVKNGELPAGILRFLNGEFDRRDLHRRSEIISDLAQESRMALERVFSQVKHSANKISEIPLNDLRQKIARWRDETHRLVEMTELNLALLRAEESDFGFVRKHIEYWSEACNKLEIAVKRSFLHGVIQHGVELFPALERFDRHEHMQRLDEFNKSDRKSLLINRKRVQRAHLDNRPTGLPRVGIWAEFLAMSGLKRNHKSIRWAMDRVGPQILKIKPVFMMSPLTVSRYLSRDQVKFDVVIFDEASQITPEDALPAIVRAHQTIVVGDSKQLPPTAFFSSLMNDSSEQQEDSMQVTTETESVLNLFSSKWTNSHRVVGLRWHYRSKHQSLIRPSNRWSYDNKLVVFPSPELGATEEMGLSMVYDASHVYDRGGSGANAEQAAAVAKAVVQHIRTNPERSLGVATFSTAQQTAVQDALELALREIPAEFESFQKRHPFERLFVKNLERVQGDERDAIFISIGYGPDVNGKMHMNFGPIAQEGGERRLNVLMSRARLKCTVFSSITGDSIPESATRSRGVEVLRSFLKFAQSGELDDPKPIPGGELNVFEEQVARAIRERGYEVHAQVGCIGYAIDLAVVHPEYPGKYVLAIECDGATYHSARSARDRDRLRQAALEARGWRFHRVWSTAWFKQRQSEVDRCLEAIGLALVEEASDGNRESEVQVPEDLPTVMSVPPVQSVDRLRPYLRWQRPLHLGGVSLTDLPSSAMANLVTEILATESPLHEQHLAFRIREVSNVARLGPRIAQSVQEGIQAALSRGKIKQIGEFFHLKSNVEVQPRDWSLLPDGERKSHWVSDDELRAAVLWVLRGGFGVRIEELEVQAWRSLGFSRPGKAVERSRLVISALVVNGKVVREEDHIRISLS